MIATVFEAIKLFGWLKSAGILVAAVIGLWSIYGVWHHKVYKQGADDAIAGIAREDAHWLKRGQDARSKWQECRNAGHEFDQTTMRCRQ